MTGETGQGYWGRLWAAVLGRGTELAAPPPPPAEPAVKVEPPPPAEADVSLQTQISRLKLELEDRDHRLAAMQRDFQLLQASKSQETVAAGDERMQTIFKKLSGPLANLIAMAQIADSGQPVDAESFVKLTHSLDRELARAGLERIGRVGEPAGFDVAVHQRMSGGVVHPGEAVIVRLPGFRFGRKIVNKAMVSAPDNGAKVEG